MRALAQSSRVGIRGSTVCGWTCYGRALVLAAWNADARGRSNQSKLGGYSPKLQEFIVMMYEDVIRDFARRTRTNLRAIDRLFSEGYDVYEATQLVNSTLGLLVFPQQRYVDSIPEIPLDQLQVMGWPVPQVRGGFAQAQNLRDLIRRLRNAVAHFNIEFIGDAQNRIRVLKVWNTLPNGRRTWEAELTVDDLRHLAERFIELLLNEPADDSGSSRDAFVSTGD